MSPASTRRVPLSLTVGGGVRDWVGTEGSIRVPFEHGVTIPRWRVHFQNINPREGRPGRGLVRLSQIAIGESAGDGTWIHTPTIISGELRGTPKATPWQHIPLIAGREYLLAYTWVSDVPTRRVVGGGWTASHVTAVDAKLRPTQIHPMDSWIEAEVPLSTQVVAVFGDSISSGVTATVPVRDSWPSIYARRRGILPVHYTASGDTMKGWSDPNHFKWTRWEHLSRPDFAIHAMGFNDIGNGVRIWDVQSRHLATIQIMRERLTERVLPATITPNNNATVEQLLTRRSYNRWLAERSPRPIPFHAAVSLDDLRLNPSFDVDGSHLNTKGYQHMASAVPAAEPTSLRSHSTAHHTRSANPRAGGHIEPISLTRPLGISVETLTSRSCRIPFKVPRAAHQWRIVIRNVNYRSNHAYAGQVRLNFLGYGAQRRDAAGALTSAFQSPPREIVRDVLVKDLAHEWASPWIQDTLDPAHDYMITLGYQTNGTETTRSMGAGWSTFYKPRNAELMEDESAAPTNRVPFDIRIEVDTTADTPAPQTVDLLIGDSISAASDATFPILQAPLAMANRARGAYTRLHTHGGTSIAEWVGPNWENPFSPKWQDILRYGPVDRVLIALGNNDIHAGHDLATLQKHYLSLVRQVRSTLTRTVLACTVTPRASWAGTPKEDIRQAFNDWVRSLPKGIDGVADNAHAVEDPTGHAPNPRLVAADGIHFNSSGSVSMAASHT